MTPEQFCYWLRGALEMWPAARAEGLTREQVQMLEKHLDLVIKPVTRVPVPVPVQPSSSTRIC